MSEHILLEEISPPKPRVGYLVYYEVDDTPRISQPAFSAFGTYEKALERFSELKYGIPDKYVCMATYRGETDRHYPSININDDNNVDGDEVHENVRLGIIPLIEGDSFEIF